MCYQVIERYAVCKCKYYVHAVDKCAAYSPNGHAIEEKEVLVGHTCDKHAPPPPPKDEDKDETKK